MKEDTALRQQHLSETTETNWKAIVGSLSDERNHWYDTAEMLKRQRNLAEEERDSWKVRAMQSEQHRQALRTECEALRDQLVLAEGQRDQAKASVKDIGNNWQRTYDHDCKKLIADAEHWKAEWALVMGQLAGAKAECEAVKQRAEAAEAERLALRKYAARWYEHITLGAAIDAALAVQP